MNYSWQDDPEVLDDPDPYPAEEIALPPTHRFNVGFNVNGPRYYGGGYRQLLQRGVLVRCLDEPIPRLHRRVHDGQRQLRREVGQREGSRLASR